jgi:hypothetical protein
MAARELFRRPRSFAVPAGILMLLALLLLYPSAILDGLNDSTTGALRTAPADLIVYAENAKESILRSRIDPRVREQVAGVDGVAEVATFDVMLLGGLTPSGEESVGLALLTSSTPIGPELPEPGEGYADASLKESAGLKLGDEVLVGPYGAAVKVVGFTHDTNLFFQSGMIVDKQTWLEALGVVLPEAPADGSGTDGSGDIPVPDQPIVPPEGSTPGASVSMPPTEPVSFTQSTVPGSGSASDPSSEPVGEAAPPFDTTQTLFVRLEAGADPLAVAAAVDESTGGETTTVTREEAVRSLPGMSQQATTFGYVRAVTLGVALVVVGLFLSFVTLERTPLYAVLKALGMSSRQLFTGVVIQVLLVTITAAAVAAVATWGLTHVPLDLPTSMRPVRFVETVVALGVTSVVGSVLSLRRVVRVDPASAIG